jgi:N-methylhydantoinase B/oxoprolinase/acetone carboxylase alpha subunit
VVVDAQLRRWAGESLSRIRRREVERLQGQMAALRAVVDDILALADELGRGTIEKMMAKSDGEVGLEMLMRLARESERDR